jgi:hypothetical protein
MKNTVRSSPMESLLAGVLLHGSWVASATIGLGLALAWIDSRFGTHNLAILPGISIVTVGIALFILLPVLRVALMLIVFLRERDYRFGIIAALVLTIILLGCALGARTTSLVAH